MSTPNELKLKKQWVRWCIEENKKGEKTKVPYSINGKKASTTNPKSWESYENVVKDISWQRNTHGAKYDGIGFVFNDDYTGIDIDHCVDENGVIDEWALSILRLMDTYAEFSPNDGIHIPINGMLPDDVRNKYTLSGMRHSKAAVEIYSKGRYFTMTGRKVPNTPDTINAGQSEVEQLLAWLAEYYPQKKERKVQLSGEFTLPDDRLIQKALKAKNGAQFQALWEGDISGYPSASEADQALCNHLAWWTNKNAAQMDRLFRLSALYRDDKWDRNARSGETYGEGTIRRAIEQCQGGYNPKRQERAQIILGRQLREIRDEALEALSIINDANPTIFVQSARLVQVGRDENEKAMIMHMNVAEMRNALTRAADFYVAKKKGEDVELVSALPPKDIAESILALDPAQWPFNSLEAIVETPVIRPDGTILDIPGYDIKTKLYYAPHKNMKDCRVPQDPTKEEIARALEVLKDIICDFPFPGDADLANTLALMMTPIIRPAIKRHVPLAIIDAPKQGTGKGLLSDIISIIATGETAAILTAPNNDDEWDKRITALLMSGATTITIDNIPSRLQSATLDAVLTASWWSSRILGVSKMVKVPQRATWIATGNNIRLGGDLARRCYRIRLDPFVSRPWMRTGFKHEDLATYVMENRAEIITAILTIVRGWYQAECPAGKAIPSLGTFSGWAKIVGSILEFVGIPGFLTNLDKLYDEMDEENAQWANFLQAWSNIFGSRAIAIAELHKELTKDEDHFAGSDKNSAGSALSDSLPEYLQTVMKEKPNSFKLILGKQLEKRLETCFGDENLRLEKERDTHNKVSLWKVVAGSAGSADTLKHASRENENFSTTPVIYSNGLEDSPHSPPSIVEENQENATEWLEGLVQTVIDDIVENEEIGALPATLPAANGKSQFPDDPDDLEEVVIF